MLCADTNMKDFKKIIKSEAEKMHKLHQAVHITLQTRSKDRANWQKACEEFHSYISEIDSLIYKVYEEDEYSDAELLEFVIAFLEIDPLFFRSGYIKEEMLRKIKRSSLTPKQLSRLLNILHHAVENRGTREFKAYCRLAAVIADKKLIGALETTIRHGKGAQKSRAELMFQHINQQKAHNKSFQPTANEIG